MQAFVTGFSKSNLNQDYKVVFVKRFVLDEFTGLNKEVKSAYLCICSFYFNELKGKECELTIAHSDKLGIDVCKDIKLVQKKEVK